MEKLCKNCNKNFQTSNHSIKYCNDNCKRLKKNEMHRIGRRKRIEIEKKMEYPKYLMENLNNVIQEDYQCTPRGFDEVSSIKVKSYINHFNRMSWFEILGQAGLSERLKKYIVQEYKIFYSKEKKQDMHFFSKSHPYLTYELLQSVGLDYIYNSAGIQKLRYSDEQLQSNFNEIKEQYGRVPLYSEFENVTKIRISTYAERFNLSGEVYERILEEYCTDEEILEYKNNRKIRKSEIGKITGKLATKYSVEDFDEEFKRVLNICEEKYGGNLNKRLFDKLSKFSERTFRKKLALKTWTDICKRYDYKPKLKNISELACLNMIQQITKEQFIPQKRFNWLKNEKGYKLPCDGYFEGLKLIVEFDGAHHRVPIEVHGGIEKFKKTQKHDEIKNKLIPEHGLILLRIDSRENWESEEYMRTRLQNIGILKKNE